MADGIMREGTLPEETKWRGGYRLYRAMPGPRASETKRRGEILNGDRTSTFKLEIPTRLNVRHRESAGYATVSRWGCGRWWWTGFRCYCLKRYVAYKSSGAAYLLGYTLGAGSAITWLTHEGGVNYPT